jgi:hypothetical protein
MKRFCVRVGVRPARPIITIVILIVIGVVVAAGANLAVVLAGVGAAVIVATEAADRIVGERSGEAPA